MHINRYLETLRPSLAVQQTDVHLGRQSGGVKLLDHLYRSARIASECQQIDIAAEDQTKRDGRVPQAVKTAVCAMRSGFDAQ